MSCSLKSYSKSLITPIVDPYIIAYITPSRSLEYSSYKANSRPACPPLGLTGALPVGGSWNDCKPQKTASSYWVAAKELNLSHLLGKPCYLLYTPIMVT